METKISETCKSLSRHAVQTPHHRLIISGQRQTGTTHASIQYALDFRKGKVLFVSRTLRSSHLNRQLALKVGAGNLDNLNHIYFKSVGDNSVFGHISEYSLIILDNCMLERQTQHVEFFDTLIGIIGGNIHVQVIMANSGTNNDRYWNRVDVLGRQYGFINVNVYPYRHPQHTEAYKEHYGEEQWSQEFGQREPSPMWYYFPNPKDHDHILRNLPLHKDMLFQVRDWRDEVHQHVGKCASQTLFIGGRFHYDWKEIIAVKEIEEI